jgi:1-acyl-sn-glycerol-3-phosphate acyltransferase
MVALRAKVPVVPVALKNTDRMWTYGAILPHRSSVPVSVLFGPPLDLSGLEGKRGAIEQATALLTRTLAEMLDQPIPEGKPQRRDEAKSPVAEENAPAEPIPG